MNEETDAALMRAGHQIAQLQQRITELTAERDRLRAAIEKAPHVGTCSLIMHLQDKVRMNGTTQWLPICDCWKREALEGGK